MRRSNNKGFTLVEIMIVIAIIALLAAIAIPNLLRAKLSANDALAQSTTRAISTALETYATANDGDYPTNFTTELVSATPPFIDIDYCDGTVRSGYTYDCGLATTGYSVSAIAETPDVTGSATYTVTTGGVLTSQDAN